MVVTLGELSIVRIGFMTGGTLLKSDRSLEIAIRMALRAREPFVLPQKGELGLAVIKFRAQALRRNCLPCHCVVTALARRGKAATMRVAMARIARVELQAGPSRLLIRPRRMTFLAIYFPMRTSQRELCFRVIEMVDLLPIGSCVALAAILAEFSVMLILVTGHALCLQAEKCPVQIEHLDLQPLRRRDA